MILEIFRLRYAPTQTRRRCALLKMTRGWTQLAFDALTPCDCSDEPERRDALSDIALKVIRRVLYLLTPGGL